MKIINVHISDVLCSQRMDVTYHKNNRGISNFVPLSKYVDIKGGKRIPKGMSFSSERTNYLYLRLSDIADIDNIIFDDLKCISEELYNKLKRYEIKNDQIVFSIAGTIGRVFLMKNIPKGKHIILTENCAMLFPKNGEVLPEYVSILLNCSFVQKQVEQNRIQTTIPKIGLDRIGKIQIPVIPSLSVQQRIIGIYQDAINIKIEKRKEAKWLLKSIDPFLSKELQIDQKTIIEERPQPLILNVSSIIGGRLDPIQFHSERMEMIDKIKRRKWCYLKNVVSSEKTIINSISRDDTYIGLENVDGETGAYIPLKEKESISSAALFKKGDILFPKLRPYLNKVYRAEFDGCCSTEFHIFQAYDINPDFLTIVLRSNFVLAQTKHLMTGNTLPRLQTTDIDYLIIPYPDITIQEDIVNSVSTIKNNAKKLKEEGDVLLDEAKQKIEQLILE